MSGPVTNEDIYRYLEDLSANIAEQFNELKREIVIESDITNALIIDLSANIAQQFAQVNSELLKIDENVLDGNTQLESFITSVNGDFVVVNAKLDVISQQVTDVQNYLVSEINTGLVDISKEVLVVDDKVTAVGDYLIDLSANLTAQNQVTDALIIDSVIVELAELNQGLTAGFEKQTNDINTNTNTALSQYTNTINTNTNASVSTAVSILKH